MGCPLHEADPSKAVDVFDQIMERKVETNLAYYRKMKGLSQSRLAKASVLMQSELPEE